MILVKPIPNFPDYLIDKNGTIFTNRRKTLKTLKSEILKDGYLRVRIYNEKGGKRFLVHRLVGLTWIQNPLNALEINHLDGIKTNNNVDNLEWCTRKQNIQHAFVTGLMKNGKGSACNVSILKEHEVIKIKQELKIYRRGLQKELAQKYGVTKHAIQDIKRGKSWSHLSA
jgi:DNA-binding XRE family transcriptional regulator